MDLLYCLESIPILIHPTTAEPANPTRVCHTPEDLFRNILLDLCKPSVKPSPTVQSPQQSPSFPHSPSDVAGVRFDRRELRWKASWSTAGKRNCRSFSVRRYGNEQAQKLAVEARLDADRRGLHKDCKNCPQRFRAKRALKTNSRCCRAEDSWNRKTMI